MHEPRLFPCPGEKHNTMPLKVLPARACRCRLVRVIPVTVMTPGTPNNRPQDKTRSQEHRTNVVRLPPERQALAGVAHPAGDPGNRKDKSVVQMLLLRGRAELAVSQPVKDVRLCCRGAKKGGGDQLFPENFPNIEHNFLGTGHLSRSKRAKEREF